MAKLSFLLLFVLCTICLVFCNRNNGVYMHSNNFVSANNSSNFVRPIDLYGREDNLESLHIISSNYKDFVIGKSNHFNSTNLLLYVENSLLPIVNDESGCIENIIYLEDSEELLISYNVYKKSTYDTSGVKFYKYSIKTKEILAYKYSIERGSVGINTGLKVFDNGYVYLFGEILNPFLSNSSLNEEFDIETARINNSLGFISVLEINDVFDIYIKSSVYFPNAIRYMDQIKDGGYVFVSEKLTNKEGENNNSSSINFLVSVFNISQDIFISKRIRNIHNNNLQGNNQENIFFFNDNTIFIGNFLPLSNSIELIAYNIESQTLYAKNYVNKKYGVHSDAVCQELLFGNNHVYMALMLNYPIISVLDNKLNLLNSFKLNTDIGKMILHSISLGYNKDIIKALLSVSIDSHRHNFILDIPHTLLRDITNSTRFKLPNNGTYINIIIDPIIIDINDISDYVVIEDFQMATENLEDNASLISIPLSLSNEVIKSKFVFPSFMSFIETYDVKQTSYLSNFSFEHYSLYEKVGGIDTSAQDSFINHINIAIILAGFSLCIILALCCWLVLCIKERCEGNIFNRYNYDTKNNTDGRNVKFNENIELQEISYGDTFDDSHYLSKNTFMSAFNPRSFTKNSISNFAERIRSISNPFKGIRTQAALEPEEYPACLTNIQNRTNKLMGDFKSIRNFPNIELCKIERKDNGYYSDPGLEIDKEEDSLSIGIILPIGSSRVKRSKKRYSIALDSDIDEDLSVFTNQDDVHLNNDSEGEYFYTEEHSKKRI